MLQSSNQIISWTAAQSNAVVNKNLLWGRKIFGVLNNTPLFFGHNFALLQYNRAKASRMHHASAVLASYMRIVHHKLGPVIRLNFMIDRHFICLGDTHHEDEFHKKNC